MKLFNKLYTDLSRFKNSPELRKSIIYIVASSIAYGIVFAQNFSLAYFLSIDFYGKVSLIISLFSTLYVLFTFGLNAVVLRFHFDKNHGADRKQFTSHIVSIWLLLGSILTLLLYALGYELLVVEHYLPLDYASEFALILPAAFLFSFTEIFPNFFVVEEKPLHYAKFLILTRLAIFMFLHLSIYFFAESSFHISLMLLAAGAGLCITGILAFNIFPIVKLRKEDVREILVYAFPLTIYALGGIGYSHGYRVIISNWLAYRDLAVFNLASQIAVVYYLTASSFITGLYPKAYKKLEDNQGDPQSIRFYFRALLYVGLGLLAIIFPAAFFFLTYFKDGAFFPGFQILPILLLGQFLFLLYGYNYILCTFYKKTKVLTYSMFIGVGTSLLLASILLRNNSMWGAAVPIAFGLLVQFLISLITIRRIMKKPL